MPERRRHVSKPIRVLGCFLSVVLLLWVFSMLPTWLRWGRNGFGPPVHIRDLQEVTEWTRLSFPPAAMLEDGYGRGGLSCWLIARVRLPRAEVATFLSQPLSHSEPDDKEMEYLLAKDGFYYMQEQHWPLPNPHKFLSTRFVGTSDPASGCSVLIDLDDPQVAIIYVYYYY